MLQPALSTFPCDGYLESHAWSTEEQMGDQVRTGWARATASLRTAMLIRTKGRNVLSVKTYTPYTNKRDSVNNPSRISTGDDNDSPYGSSSSYQPAFETESSRGPCK